MYSSTITCESSTSPKSMTATMPGWWSCETMRASRANNCACSPLVAKIVLITTGLAKPWAPSIRPRCTTPMPPRASCRATRYRPSNMRPECSALCTELECTAPQVVMHTALRLDEANRQRLVGGCVDRGREAILCVLLQGFAADGHDRTGLRRTRDEHARSRRKASVCG